MAITDCYTKAGIENFFYPMGDQSPHKERNTVSYRVSKEQSDINTALTFFNHVHNSISKVVRGRYK